MDGDMKLAMESAKLRRQRVFEVKGGGEEAQETCEECSRLVFWTSRPCMSC